MCSKKNLLVTCSLACALCLSSSPVAAQSVDPKLAELIADKLGVEQSAVVSSATLNGLGADSLDKVELVMALEQEYSVQISEEVCQNLVTVSDVQTLIPTPGLVCP